MKMKTFMRLSMAALLVAPLLLVGVVSAQDTTQEQSTNQTQTTTEPTAQEKAAALKARIEKRKTEIKAKITATEKTRLQARCVNSQGKLSSLSGRVKGIETSRAQVYSNLTDRLTKLLEKLQAADIDKASLEAQITELQTKIATFQTDLATYKQAVADLVDMDCKTDPEGFKNSLEAARTARKKVQDDAAAIKAYVNDTIKPTLKALRAQLEATDTNSGGEQ
jgi:hypothetical protein